MRDLISSAPQELRVAAHSRLERAMAEAGWFVDFVDLDLARLAPVATIKCHRQDGRWLRAHVDELGRCSVETFQRRSWLGRPSNAKGRWPMSPQVDDLFLGRMKPVGPRAMLRCMTDYITDNVLRPIALADMRSAWAALMDVPTKIEYTEKAA